MDLHHQFLISRTSLDLPEGWKAHLVNDVFVGVHPSLPVHHIEDEAGIALGLVLGWAITTKGRLIDGNEVWPVSCQRIDEASIETQIYDFSGRYAVLIATPSLQRLYLDPAGSLGCVFDRKHGLAGSTLSALMLSTPGDSVPRGTDAYSKLGANQFYPAGLTADPEIHRLLPNHYLDLDHWHTHRHYPNEGDELPGSEDPSTLLHQSAQIIENALAALTSHYSPLYLTLTAGADSRIMLACAKGLIDQIRFITFDYRNHRNDKAGAAIDVETAETLARRFNLNHQLLLPDKGTPEIRSEYHHLTGFSGSSGKSSDFLAACRSHLNLRGALVLGHAGSVGSGYYWRGIRSENERLSGKKLLRRMRLPNNNRFVGAMNAWLDGFPSLSASQILDYLYVENRIGCWASPHYYGTAPFSAALSPFSHRKVFDAAHSLKRIYPKEGKSLSRGIVAHAWPELEPYPINNFIGHGAKRHRLKLRLKSSRDKALRLAGIR